MRRIRAALAVLAVLAVLAGGCGGDDSEDTAPPVSLPGKVNDHGTAKAENGLDLEADDLYFGPTFIEAKAGQRFSVELHNEGDARHTFTSSELGVDLELTAGARRTISLTAPATGLADFHCRFHEGQGMKGAVFIA
jgi:plastocyanin